MKYMMIIGKPNVHEYQLWEDSTPLSEPQSSPDKAFQKAGLGMQSVTICDVNIPEDSTEILCRLQWLAEEHLRIGQDNHPKSMELRKISNMLFALLKEQEAQPVYSD